MAAHWLVSTANGWLVRNMRRTRLGISDQGSGNELRGWACENEYTWCGSLGDPSEAYRMPDLLALYPAQHRLRLMYTKCVVERSKTGPSSHVPWVCHVPYHPGISGFPFDFWIGVKSYAIGHRSTSYNLTPESSLLPFFLSLIFFVVKEKYPVVFLYILCVVALSLYWWSWRVVKETIWPIHSKFAIKYFINQVF